MMENSWLNPRWPALTHYDQDHIARIAMPLGGIGTGTVSLGGRGNLKDWEIVNRPAKGFTPIAHRTNYCAPFFALSVKEAGGKRTTRALEGALQPPFDDDFFGAGAPNHGLPRFQDCSFHAAYPMGQVLLRDPAVPVDVRIEAFNPLIPGDADRSGIPAAFLRYVIKNTGTQPVEATVCGSLINFIGTDGRGGKASKNRNEYRREGPVRGLWMTSDGVDPDAEQFGTMAFVTQAEETVTHRESWAPLSWGNALLDFWDDLHEDGRLDAPNLDVPRDKGGPVPNLEMPIASLAVTVDVAPGEEKAVPFLIAWHFPNRMTWSPDSQGSADEACCGSGEASCKGDPRRIGNYYCTQYRDAWDVAVRAAAEWDGLEGKTLRFVNALCESDLPSHVKEAALYNLSTLRSQTCFRTEDGFFYGFEGCSDHEGCCMGSCTHVWNYEQATAFLFGDLARGMREIEFMHAVDEQGLMSFRTHLPLHRAQEWGKAAADGQMGCLLKLYRDWKLSGDQELLRRLWPNARRAMEFCWIEGGWDADQDGVMEGCQHNTLDVEYFGPNPLMGSWYLGALRAAEEMAEYLGEDEFASKCRDLFRRGSDWMDDRLFNGEYYEQEVIPPADLPVSAEGLRWNEILDPTDPPHQIGSGCLVDQLAGQYFAHICGLGYLLREDHVKTTLRSIMKYNFKDTLRDHFNHLRTYALNDEAGLVICSYPRGERPKQPTPYYNEFMTGFEYTAAVHMLFEGHQEDGLRCIAAIRDRYDGRKRNPFNEIECGYHYARAMASWSAVVALSGFWWSGVDHTMTFGDNDGTHFWANGYAWGSCEQRRTSDAVEMTLTVLHGTLRLKRVIVTGRGEVILDPEVNLSEDESITLRVPTADAD